MSSLIDGMPGRGGRRFATARRNDNLARPARLALMCLAVSAGYVAAQTCEETPGQKSTCPGGKPKPSNVGPLGPGFPLDPGLIPLIEGEGIVGDDQEPEPRWYCFDPIAKPEPVWQGKPLKHTFEICNLGTADLRIRADAG